MNKQLVNPVGEFSPDNLINSSIPPALAFGVKLRAAQGVLARGTVLGLSTDGDYVILGTTPQSGETITANCILADPADASGPDEVTAVAYRTGHMNRNALIVEASYTLTAADEEELRKGGILLSDAQPA